MGVAEATEISPTTALQALGLVGELERLQVLDDLWTAYTAQADLPAALERDREPILQIITEMLNLLSRLPGQVAAVRQMLNDLSDGEVNQALDGMLQDGPITSADAREILGVVLADYELRGAMITACDYALRINPLAIDQLNDKLRLVQSLELQHGDLPPAFKCSLYLVIAGAGIAAAIAGSGGTVIVIAGVTQSVGSSVWGFKSSGCRETWADITSEVRG